jgi:uncharacterized C2H2 Zn-finger protein
MSRLAELIEDKLRCPYCGSLLSTEKNNQRPVCTCALSGRSEAKHKTFHEDAEWSNVT